MFFGEIFLFLVLLFFTNKFLPETIRSKKKVGFIFHPSFYVQYCRIRNPVLFYPQDPDPG
jgi:hypothetical protein